MKYFEKDYVDFFKELSQNNNKEWFDLNRKRYEKNIKKPFTYFITDIIAEIALDDPHITIQAKDAMFRINRDIRFSNDKSPYKLHMAAVITRGTKKDHTTPGFYIQLGNEGISLAGGIYESDKDSIQSFRTYIANNLEEFKEVYSDKIFTKHFKELKGEKNKIIPKEFKELIKSEPLIANKQLYYWTDLDKKLIYSDNLKDIIMEYYYSAKNVKDFLTRALGK
jgi:uncharacterized protein (TIGR02453 family)